MAIGGVRPALPCVAPDYSLGYPAMTIRHFAANGRVLLGGLHQPTRLRARGAAVLLCNPFGEEAARAHRTYRVLASRLERAGYAAMRFDYAGTGDSAGSSEDFGVDDWLDDIVAAAAELRRESGSAHLVLVGLRLGATLAALATVRRELRARHLVLWDPVTDGAAYLRELASAHRQYMDAEMGAAGWHGELRMHADGTPAEALGMEITPALAAALGNADLAREVPRAEHLTVVSSRPTPELARWRAQLPDGPGLQWIELPDGGAWNSDAALNAAVVPMQAIGAVLARIEELCP